MTSSSAKRFFFALMPDDRTRDAIRSNCRKCVVASGGRAVAAANLHLTVAFLGDIDAGASQRAKEASYADVGPFDIVLDRVGYWPGGRVLWVEPSVPHQLLLELERSLWGSLEELGFERERRRYRPHVTLARRAGRAGGSIAPVRWHVEQLSLVESVADGPRRSYRIEASWAL